MSYEISEQMSNLTEMFDLLENFQKHVNEVFLKIGWLRENRQHPKVISSAGKKTQPINCTLEHQLAEAF